MKNQTTYTYFIFCTHTTDPKFKNESIVDTPSPICSDSDIQALKKILLEKNIFFKYGTSIAKEDIIINNISLLNISLPTPK